MTKPLKTYFENSITYTQYRDMIDRLLDEKKTTGDNHSEAMINYTKMNVVRMKRLEKTTKLNEDLGELLKKLNRKQQWIAITEAWCGDAAQSIPVLAKIAEDCEAIEMRCLLRDENLELMDRYLTNGGRSIPKLISFDAESGEELFNWGPRPDVLQDMFMEMKEKKMDFAELSEKLHTWYAKDKTNEIQKEMFSALKKSER